MNLRTFDEHFAHLTGNSPFPWQRRLFERFIAKSPSERFPQTCDIPTGLGKTSVIAIWLLALARHVGEGQPRSFPRRLVYVVNRRTVVDQSTREAEALRANLKEKPELREIAGALQSLAARPNEPPLAISTLRGQFADNAEWRNDPARPAVVVGTVDMIGSRLLFSGYGRGFKSRPLHAGFLGQDALLVHDEAHLEPAFQALVEAIHAEQQRNDWERGRFQVMALSATARSGGHTHTITDEDLEHDTVKQRVYANKAIGFHDVTDDKKVAERVVEIALHEEFKNSGNAILVYVRQVKDVLEIKSKLVKAKQQVETLTGTLRGYERENLVATSDVFARFMPKSDVPVAEGTVYLICTSAGEVGVNISADHLICDLSPFDSMAQRFGRIHRFGKPREHVARIEIVASTAEPEDDDDLGQRIKRTRELLEKLRGDGSPAALRRLSSEERLAAFSPQPDILPVTDILLDAWALTTIRGSLPGRPPVDAYLHGISDYEPPQTQVAWRAEVQRVVDENVLDRHPPEELFEDFPLKSHEMISDRTDRVVGELAKIVEREPDAIVWIVESAGAVGPRKLSDLLSGDKKRDAAALAGRVVLLPPRVGGLSDGLLDGVKPHIDGANYDIADKWDDESGRSRRKRIDDPGERPPSGMRLIRQINLSKAPEEIGDDEPGDPIVWRWYVQPRSADDDGSRTARAEELLTDHLGKAGAYAQAIAGKVLEPDEQKSVVVGAALHDLGKNRRVWQRSIGNTQSRILAKSGPAMRPRDITSYRHEFGSLIDVMKVPAFLALDLLQRELALHLIAAHHGRARPHFPLDEAFDPERSTEMAQVVAREVPRRFADLQTRYGRWGLAYLESLVRAADALASQDIGEGKLSTEAAE